MTFQFWPGPGSEVWKRQPVLWQSCHMFTCKCQMSRQFACKLAVLVSVCPESGRKFIQLRPELLAYSLCVVLRNQLCAQVLPHFRPFSGRLFDGEAHYRRVTSGYKQACLQRLRRAVPVVLAVTRLLEIQSDI